jgi:hypothetical protein
VRTVRVFFKRRFDALSSTTLVVGLTHLLLRVSTVDPTSRRVRMTTTSDSSKQPAVLRTESKDEFAKLIEELNQEIKPANFIERMYVEDIANLVWDIKRLRRIKTGIINNAFQRALKTILRQIQFKTSSVLPPAAISAPDDLAYDWLFTQESKDRVSSLLQEAGLDEFAVEAEAFRVMIDDIEKVDRALAVAEVRRDNALRMIAECKETLSARIQQSAERVLAADNAPSLQYVLPEN